ncbi:MAG: PAS domain-containing protein, partial [Bdellovibrionales bacterium]|nr:PAS domain-containing protein [Bdellovibrionales bacterium]
CAYGFENSAFQGTLEKWLETISPEDSNFVKSTITDSIKNGLEELNFDYRLKMADGTIRYINVFAKRTEHGTFVGLNRDVTKEVNTQNMQSSLLETGQMELEALAYAISHDLRAPLRGIDEEARGYLNRVRSETKYMSNLIDDLLKISQIAKTKIKLVGLNLSEIAESVSKQFLSESSGRKVHVQIQPDMFIQGDENFMKMVVSCLFSNSFKFTSKLPEANIEFGKTLVEGKEVFYIKDNGAGFNSSTAKKLFGTFQRMHRQQEFPGNGTGLSIVKRIINLHQGRIWAESFVDSGATFFFTINDKKV